MAVTKLGVALFMAVASNVTLLSMLLKGDDQQSSDTATSASTATSAATPTITTAPKTTAFPAFAFSSSNLEDFERRRPIRPSNLRASEEFVVQQQPLAVDSDGRTKVSEARTVLPLESEETNQQREEYSEGFGKELPQRTEEEVRRGAAKEGRQEGGGTSSERSEDEFPPRSERSTLGSVDAGHYLEDVIASLTEVELQQLDSSTSKTLIPALIALESMVLSELERLHDVSVHQELRLEILEKRQLQEEEIMEAANVLREEQYLLQRKKQKEALEEQKSESSPNPQQQQPQQTTTTVAKEAGSSVTKVVDFQDVTLEPLDAEDADGSGGSGEEEPLGAELSSSTSAPASNYSESSDSAIINHIYEIYSSLTSMEHKVMELGSSLTIMSAELYRQRSTFVRLEDKVEEVKRNQRTLVMRSTMHTFKITDLEQFKSQAEMLMRTAEGAIEQFNAKLEIFKDRVTAQQDEVQAMRGVFNKLEQSTNELRAADAYKAHDIQELKRRAQQVETRLSSLYHSLDRYVGNVRWDVKTYLDHLCSSNDLQC